MEQDYNFTFQESMYSGECLPCTAAVFNHYVDDPMVAWKIKTRRAVEEAINKGLPLDRFAENPGFKKFCQKKQAEKGFADLTFAQKLLQWATSLKSSLPCYIFAVCEFEQKRRKLSNILHLSGLFMFDARLMSCVPAPPSTGSSAPACGGISPLGHKADDRHRT